jgi:hypothetical protein
MMKQIISSNSLSKLEEKEMKPSPKICAKVNM